MNLKNQRKKYLTIALCGKSGTGKTSQLGTLAKLGPGLIIDFDGKLTPLTGLDIEALPVHYWSKNAESLWPQLMAALRTLSIKLQASPENLDLTLKVGPETFTYKGPPFRWIAADTMTLARKVMMAHLTSLKDVGQPMSTRLGLPTQQAWTGEQMKTIDFLTLLKSLPCHQVVTFHESVRIIEETGEVFVGPDVTGKLSGQLAGYFDEFYATRIRPGKVTKYIFLTGGSSRYVANSTISKILNLPKEIDTTFGSPGAITLYDIITAWEGGKDELVKTT